MATEASEWALGMRGSRRKPSWTLDAIDGRGPNGSAAPAERALSYHVPMRGQQRERCRGIDLCGGNQAGTTLHRGMTINYSQPQARDCQQPTRIPYKCMVGCRSNVCTCFRVYHGENDKACIGHHHDRADTQDGPL